MRRKPQTANISQHQRPNLAGEIAISCQMDGLRHGDYACDHTERTKDGRVATESLTVFMTLVEGKEKMHEKKGKALKGAEERPQESRGITQKNGPVRSCYL